jgi:hypothetical protein
MSQSSGTPKRFRFLRFSVYIFYFFAALCVVVGFAAGLGYYQASQLGRYDPVNVRFAGAPPNIPGTIVVVFVGIVLAFLMVGLSQFISLQLANEENTRKTQESLARLVTRRQP